MPPRLAVFASGGGSNLKAIIESVEQGKLPLVVALCVSNAPDAGALGIAERHGVPTAVLNPKRFGLSAEYAEALLGLLREREITFVALAGYLRKIPSSVVTAFKHRMVNIHPSLLPSFGGRGLYGRRVHEAVLSAGARQSGATVHFVDDEYDTGPILLQESVPVLPDDTPALLAARVLRVEHQLYPAALGLLARGLLHVDGQRVRLLDNP